MEETETPVITDMKILIVDDDEAFNHVLSKYISKKYPQAQIFQAFDGFEAGIRMVEKMPDCIVLDLDLPGIDGVKLCQKMKQSDAFGHPEIVIMTGLEDIEKEKQCAELGIKYYFKKPIFIPEIIKTIGIIYNNS